MDLVGSDCANLEVRCCLIGSGAAAKTVDAGRPGEVLLEGVSG